MVVSVSVLFSGWGHSWIVNSLSGGGVSHVLLSLSSFSALCMQGCA